MPILIDIDREVDLAEGERDLETGVPLILPKGAESEVIQTHYISMDKDKADWQPQGSWHEQVTTDVGGGRRKPRILIKGLDGEPRAVNVDDGLIIDITATMRRKVGMLPGRSPMSEDEVEDFLDASPDEHIPMFQEWCFRVTGIAKTDGPDGRANMLKSEDKKRIESQTEMFQTFTELFKQGFAAQNGGNGDISAHPDFQKALEAGITAGVVAEQAKNASAVAEAKKG
jgi:hypothetical protein